jgi:hypothetical protein
MSKTKILLRPLALVLATFAMAVFGGFATVAHAAFTGENVAPVPATNLYISKNYNGSSEGTGEVHVKAGVAIPKFRFLEITFSYLPEQISIYNDSDWMQAGDALIDSNGTSAIVIASDAAAGTYKVTVTLATSVAVAKDQTLFRLPVAIKKVVGPLNIAISNVGTVTLKEDATVDPVDVSYTNPRFSSGLIKIPAATCSPDCGEFGACDATTAKCVCDRGFFGPKCNQCDIDAGYVGYPKCTLGNYAFLKGIILTLSQDAVGKLSMEERNKAYSSVYVILKNVVSDYSQKIKLGTVEYDLGCTSHADGEVAQIRECALNLKEDLEFPSLGTPALKASVMGGGMEGVVKVEPMDPNGTLYGIYSTSDDVLIVPGMKGTMVMDPLLSYRMNVIGISDDDVSKVHTVKEFLTYNDVTWKVQPANRLEDAALKGGLLEREKTGKATGPLTSPVYVEFTKPDTTKINSNTLTVEVPSGPVINYAQVMGAGSIEQGSRVNLSVKVSDVDTMSDINDIRTAIVKPTDPDPKKNTTYAEIMADATATRYTATPFVPGVKVTASGTAPVAPAAGSTPATPVVENYRIYTIPVDIVKDPNLMDGNYKLVLSFTDKAGHTSATVLPLQIGKNASGDVDGDGKLSLLDVLLSYQFANGKMNPSPSQAEAANLDGVPGITMMDVVLLFNKVNNK